MLPPLGAPSPAPVAAPTPAPMPMCFVQAVAPKRATTSIVVMDARPLRIFVPRTGNLSLTASPSDRAAARPARSRQELWTRSCEPYCAYPSETVPASECRKGGGHDRVNARDQP